MITCFLFSRTILSALIVSMSVLLQYESLENGDAFSKIAIKCWLLICVPKLLVMEANNDCIVCQ
jgi:hypothetical protein